MKGQLLDYFKQVYNVPKYYFSLSRNTNVYCEYLSYLNQLAITRHNNIIISKNATKQRIDEFNNLLEILRNEW